MSYLVYMLVMVSRWSLFFGRAILHVNEWMGRNVKFCYRLSFQPPQLVLLITLTTLLSPILYLRLVENYLTVGMVLIF